MTKLNLTMVKLRAIILVVLISLIIYLNRIERKEKSETRREKKRIEDEKFMGKK